MATANTEANTQYENSILQQKVLFTTRERVLLEQIRNISFKKLYTIKQIDTQLIWSKGFALHNKFSIQIKQLWKLKDL